MSRETSPNLGERALAPGGDAEVRTSEAAGIKRGGAATPGHLRSGTPPPAQHSRPELCPSSRRRRRSLHIRYPGGSGLRGRGRRARPVGAGRGGDAAVAPQRQWVKVRPGVGKEAAGAKGGGGSENWRDGSPSESSHPTATAGTSYWMYCFLHSGVMCAERCSANFILPFPSHSHPGPAATGGGGGGNSDSDSSPHGPRRGTALRFSPPPPPPRSPQSRPPAIFLLLFIAPPRPAPRRHRHGNRLRRAGEEAWSRGGA